MPNRLARETSPYPQQHADNPVDRHPWGEEARRHAREQDKPILVSVGRSACHASARSAAAFLAGRMWQQGRVLATYKDDRAHLNAYLDDYAFLLAALLEAMQAEFAVGDP